MRSFAFIPVLAGLSYALPQAASSCVTVTTEVIIPTITYTYTSTPLVTVTETTPDVNTFTLIIRESSTKTLGTITNTTTVCTASGTITAPVTSTVYTTSGVAATSGYTKRNVLDRRDNTACTVTSTFTTTYGQTEAFVEASETSTFHDYSEFIEYTTTSTRYGGTAYAIATAVATSYAVCGPTANATAASTTTVTQDARCAPSALTSEYDGFGLEYADDTPAGGATYVTSTSDASECCQLCAEAVSCAASSWDVRTEDCKLEFPTDYNTGDLNCGEGLLVYYDAGPDHPMAPGTGLYVGTLCGDVEYGNAAPDDGT